MLSIHYGETSIGKFAEPCHSLSLGTNGHGSPETTIPKGTCAFGSLGALLVANVGCMWLGPACRFYEILKKGTEVLIIGLVQRQQNLKISGRRYAAVASS